MPFPDFLQPVAFALGPFEIRWYALAYLAGVLLGAAYATSLLSRHGLWRDNRPPFPAPAIWDFAFWAVIGIVVGGRIGYVLFYNPAYYLHHPIAILKLWDGGMSFHGGVIGTTLGILYLSWKEKLPWLRIHDYAACCVPFGLFFGRIANFVNHELWGATTNVPWAVRFPEVNAYGMAIVGPPRHPTQLYEALLEGVVLFAILAWMFWRTQARYEPGKLVGAFLFFYGAFRFLIEFVRMPDQQLSAFTEATGLHMGQWLSLPMILGGAWLMWTAKGRRVRVEPTLGSASVS